MVKYHGKISMIHHVCARDKFLTSKGRITSLHVGAYIYALCLIYLCHKLFNALPLFV